jgi:hypothetical protein
MTHTYPLLNAAIVEGISTGDFDRRDQDGLRC